MQKHGGIQYLDGSMSGSKNKQDDGQNDQKNTATPVVITDVLDLHGFFPQQVKEVVEEFLQNGKRLNLTHLRIIHGKGRSRLKFETYRVLKSNPLVRDFYDAPPSSGGWGATIVELRY